MVYIVDDFKQFFQANGQANVDDFTRIHHSPLLQDEIQDVEDVLFKCPITKAEAEIKFAINNLKVNKSCGGNHSVYLKLFNRFFVNGEFPLKWAEFFIVPLQKKGNLDHPDNFRGI